MNIQIQIDPSQAVSAAGGITQAVAKTEDAGAKAGKTIATAMMEAEDAMKRAKAGALSYQEGLTLLDHVGSGRGLAAQLEREAAMFEKINGPLRDYTNNLAAADSLLSKNMITTEQYSEQVRKLNEQLDRQSTIRTSSTQGAQLGPTFDPAQAGAGGSGGGAADSGGGMGALASLAGAAGVATSFVAAGVAAIQLNDKYIELTNSVQRFATSQHTAAAIVQSDLAIAGNLHASLAETVGLYSRLREGTDDLNISSAQYDRLTQSLGEEAKLSGKSMGDAEAVVTRLSFAMDNGGIKSRELKSMMREMPELAHTWETSLGKTSAQLMRMADDGTLDIKQLMNAMIDNGDAIDEKFSKRVVTAGERWQHLKDGFDAPMSPTGSFKMMIDHANQIMIPGQEQEKSPLSKMFGDSDPQADDTAALARQQQMFGDSGRSLFNSLGAGADDAYQKIKMVGQALTGISTNQDPWNGPKASAGAFTTTLLNLNDALYKANTGMEGMLNTAGEFSVKFGQVANVLAATALGAGAFEKLNPWTHLTPPTGKLSEAQKILEQIIGPMKAYRTEYAALESLSKNGLINNSQFDTEASKLQKTFEDQSGITAKIEAMRSLEGALSGIEKHSGAAEEALEKLQKAQSVVDDAVAKGIRTPDQGAATMDAFRGQLQKQVTQQNDTPAEKYGDELKVINAFHQEGVTDAQHYAKAIADLDERYTTIRTPLEDYQLAQKKLAEQIATGLPSSAAQAIALQDLHDKFTLLKTPAEDYAAALRKVAQEASNGLSSQEAIDDALRKTREQFGDSTFADGVVDGFKAIKAQVMDTAGIVKTEMTGAFDSVNKSLTELITTGTTDWKKMFQGLETQAVGGALKGVEGSALGALGLGNSPASGNAAMGAAATSSATALTGLSAAAASATASLAGLAGASDVSSAGSIPSIGGLFGVNGTAGSADGTLPGASDAADASAAATVAFYQTPSSASSGYGSTAQATARDRSSDKTVNHIHLHLDPKELVPMLHPHLQDLVKTEVVKQSATAAMARSKR